MKKIIVFLLALLFMTPSVLIAKDNNKDLAKVLKKERAQKIKELKKGNWELFGSSRTLDVALAIHYDKLNTLGDNAYEIVGVASNFKSKNVGKQMATNNACLTYAQLAGSSIKGNTVSDIYANATDGSGEFDHFYAAYERAVAKDIRNEMNESFSLIRQLSDGSYEMQVFYIINEDAASKMRQKAIEDAAKETDLAQDYAEKIAQYVRNAPERQ